MKDGSCAVSIGQKMYNLDVPTNIFNKGGHFILADVVEHEGVYRIIRGTVKVQLSNEPIC